MNKSTKSKIIRSLRQTKGLNWNHLCNAVICCLLRTGERENIYKALWCASRGAVVPYSNSWYIALNDAYLGSVQQSRLSSQFVLQWCNLLQLLNTQKSVYTVYRLYRYRIRREIG